MISMTSKGKVKQGNSLNKILVARETELPAGLLKDIGQVGARGDFDRRPPQVGGYHHDVGGHGLKRGLG